MNARSLLRLLAVALAVSLPITLATPWTSATDYLQRFLSPDAGSVLLSISIALLWSIAIVFLARKDQTANRVNLIAELIVAIVLMGIAYFWQTTAFFILFELVIVAWTATLVTIVAPKPRAGSRR